MEDKLLETIAYILPALVVGFVAQYMFKGFIQQQANQRNSEMLSAKKKESLPVKLQAYERMLLFIDRVKPIQLIARVPKTSDNILEDLAFLKKTINQEFEHNFVQQLYLSDDAWKAIVSTKQLIEYQLEQIAENSSSVKEFREKILLAEQFMQPKVDTVVQVLKANVRKLL